MGNSTSSTASFFMRPELDEEGFLSYAQAEWRSERSRELDKLGGPSRPPCPRGQSFTSKSLFLRHQLIQSAEDMQLVITPPPLPGSAALKPNRIDMAEFNLHTDKRAFERKEAANIYHVQNRRPSDDSADIQRDSTSKDDRRKPMERKERRFSAITASAAARAIAVNDSEERPSAPLRVVQILRRSSSLGAVTSGQERSLSLSPVKLILLSKKVAEWRKRCHAARRRVMIIIRTALRLKRGRPRPPPRLPRLDDLSFLIPSSLSTDKAAFLTEYCNFLDLQEDLESTKAAISEKSSPLKSPALPAATAPRFHSPARPPRPPLAPLSPHRPLNPSPSLEDTPMDIGGLYERSSLPMNLSLLKASQQAPLAPQQATQQAPLAPSSVPSSPLTTTQQANEQRSKSMSNRLPPVSPMSPTLVRASLPRPAMAQSPPGPPRWNAPSAKPLVPVARSNSESAVLNNGRASTSKSRRSSRLALETQPDVTSEANPKNDPSSLSNLSLAELKERLELKTAMLTQSTSMLAMFLNRCNVSWAQDVQQWRRPTVMDAQSEAIWSKGSDVGVYKADLVRKLKQGKVAVQVFASCDESIEVDPSTGERSSLWGSDPWELVQAVRPGLMPMLKDRIQGVGLGGRALSSLVQQLTLIGGREAVGQMTLILHLSDDQEEEVVRELEDRKFYGLERDKVIFLVQQRQGGFTYDLVNKLWVDRPEGSEAKGARTYGSGHALAMLTWPSEAFVLGDDGIKSPLLLPTLEVLESSGVEWIISRRMRDLSLLSLDGIIDALGLPYRMWVKDQANKRLSVIHDGAQVDTMTLARQHGSVFLHNSRSDSAAEVALSSLASPELAEMLEEMKTRGIVVGLGRAIYHLPSLKTIVKSMDGLFHPQLELFDGCIRVDIGAENISLKAKTALTISRHPLSMIVGADSMEALIAKVLEQDSSPGFRSHVVELINSRRQAAQMVIASTPGGAEDDSMTYVVFVTSNQISQRAVNAALFLARPGRDEVRLVTVVPTEVQRSVGSELLLQFNLQVVRAMLSVRSDVLVRGEGNSLLDMMEAYLDKECRRSQCMVVMGSQKITSSVFDSVVGSVTLSFIRRLVGVPIIVVTLNSKQSPSPQSTSALRVMVEVEPQSRGVLRLVAKNLLSTRKEKGTHLFLAHVHPVAMVTRKQESDHRRLVESFELLASGLRAPPSRSLMLCGKVDEAIAESVAEHAVNLVALQLQPGSKALSTSIVRLMRSSKAATLIYTTPRSSQPSEVAKD